MIGTLSHPIQCRTKGQRLTLKVFCFFPLVNSILYTFRYVVIGADCGKEDGAELSTRRASSSVTYTGRTETSLTYEGNSSPLGQDVLANFTTGRSSVVTSRGTRRSRTMRCCKSVSD